MTGERLTPPTPPPSAVAQTRNLRRPGLPADGEPVRPSEGSFTLSSAEPASCALPVVIGRYFIEGELGRGGMGVVYRARDPQLNRTVALKLLPGLHLASPESQRRFRIEAEATARLHHPNIVQIHELGTHQEPTGAVIPYLALEYVEGGTLSQRLRGRALPPLEAAALVEQLAHAIQHAHQHNIVHRDLKPSNILIAECGVRSADSGQSALRTPHSAIPKITDFGLALRLEEHERLTQSGAAMGTPAYMAPEQASGRSHDTGPAVDIYALGALLYECLTGRPPFDNSDTLVCLQQLVYDDPLPPRRLSPGVPRDLETICLKCLEKEPRRRYASAAALADDLHGFQEGLPIAARPVGRLERGLRWCRRRPLVAGLLAGLVVSVLLGVSGVTWKFIEVEQQRFQAETGKRAAVVAEAEAKRRAEEATRQKAEAEKNKLEADNQSKRATLAAERAQRSADEAQRLSYSLLLSQAHRDWRECNIEKARQTLHDCPAALRGWEHAYLLRLFDSNQRTVGAGLVSSVALSPDGRHVAVGYEGGVGIHLVASTQCVQRLSITNGNQVHVAFHPDGKRLALLKETYSSGGRAVGYVELWDWTTARCLYTTPQGSYSRCIHVSPDGKRLVCVSFDASPVILDAETGTTLATLQRSHPEAVNAARFSPDGAKVVTTGPRVGSSHVLRVWDTQTGKWEKDLPTLHFQPIRTLAFSGDGKWLATGCTNGEVQLWNWRELRLDRVQRCHTDLVTALAFDPRGERLVSCGFDKQVVVWPFAQQRPPTPYRGHLFPITGVTFTPDGMQVISGATDRTVKWWEVSGEQECLAIPSALGGGTMAFHPDGQRFATFRPVFIQGKSVAEVTLFKDNVPPLWTQRRPLGYQIRKLEFSADGQWLLIADYQGGLEVLNVHTGELKWNLAHDGTYSAAFDPSGQRIAVVGTQRVLLVLESASGKELLRHRLDAERPLTVAFSADGRQVIVGDENGVVKVRRGDTGAELRVLRGLATGVTALAVSRDGRWIAGASATGELAIWDGAATKACVMRGHKDSIHCLTFNARGDRLVSGGRDGHVKFWRTDSGHEVLTLPGDRELKLVRFYADEQLLMGIDVAGWTRVWDRGGAPPLRR